MQNLNMGRQQRGVTLLVSLIVLTIATLIAVYAMKTTTFQLKMSANERVIAQTFWCGKSVLDTQYEYNFRRTRLEESIFQKALTAPAVGNYVQYDAGFDASEIINWALDPDGNPSKDNLNRTADFSAAYTQNAAGVKPGDDQDNVAYGFEFNSRCSIGDSASEQVYGVTAYGFQRPGSLVQ